MKIAILIPAFNESKTIGTVVREAKAKGLDVIVIDDCSKDDTGTIACQQGAEVLRNDPNMGKGASLRRGFNYCIDKKYDGVIALDGDGQHAVDDLNRFIEVANTQPVCIITGNRMVNAKGMPLVRYLTNRFMSFLISSACHQVIPDTQCGYRYMSCEILKNIKLDCNTFEIETEILMKASKKGYKIVSVPITTIYRDEVSKINPIKDTIRFFKYFIREINSQ